jgi:hypothetical protein
VKVEDGKLVQWTLNRTKLETLLKDVLAQPITQRFLDSDPNGMINLYYGESDEYPLIRSEDLQACAYLPQGETLPTSGQPLRGFSFNHPGLGSGFYTMQIVFMENSLRIYDLNLRPSSAADEFWMSLLPADFKPLEAPSFTRIDAMSRGPAINVMWSKDTSPAEESYYNAMFSGWEVMPLTYDPGLKLTGKWFDLTPEGKLVLLDCQAP